MIPSRETKILFLIDWDLTILSLRLSGDFQKAESQSNLVPAYQGILRHPCMRNHTRRSARAQSLSVVTLKIKARRSIPKVAEAFTGCQLGISKLTATLFSQLRPLSLKCHNIKIQYNSSLQVRRHKLKTSLCLQRGLKKLYNKKHCSQLLRNYDGKITKSKS